MRQYTQDELQSLIICRKAITDPPRRQDYNAGGHKRNDMKLQSMDGDNRFSVFMRVNNDFPENFSIGLVYHPSDERGAIALLRLNGPHGEYIYDHNNVNAHHSLFHFHVAKEDNIQAGRSPEWGGIPVDCYASYEQALDCFINIANIENAYSYFPKHRFPMLFNPDEV